MLHTFCGIVIKVELACIRSNATIPLSTQSAANWFHYWACVHNNGVDYCNMGSLLFVGSFRTQHRMGLDVLVTSNRPMDHPLGWRVVAGSFMVQFLAFGVMNSYTTFTHLMEHDPQLGYPSKVQLSLGASISAGIGPLLGVVAGYLVDRHGSRPMIFCVGLFLAFALLVGSFARSVAELVILYSVPVSLASACTSSPVSTAIGSWFSKKLSIAFGVTYSGGGVGNAVLPLVAGHLAHSLNDWRASFRYMSLFTILGLVATVLMSVRSSKGNDTKTEDSKLNGDASPGQDETREPLMKRIGSALKIALPSKAFWAIYLCSFFFCYSFFGSLYVIIPYVTSFGSAPYQDREIIKVERAASFFTWFGVAGVIGDILVGVAGYALNTKIAFSVCGVVGGIAGILLAFCSGYWSVGITFTVIGFAYAGCFAMFPALLVQHFLGPHLGTVMGLGFTCVGVAALTAAPLTAYIANHMSGDYTLSLALIGGNCLLGGIICQLFVPPPPIQSWQEEENVVAVVE